MKNIYIIFVCIALLASCESSLVDFTDVTNPNLSEASVVGQPNSTESILGGVQRQFSIMENATADVLEITTDNYVNTATFFNQNVDGLTIGFQDPDINTLQFNLARLRELTIFGIDEVAPADVNVTDEILAQLYFYQGLSFLYAAEIFSVLPGEVGGVPLTSTENFQEAISRFSTALSLSNQSSYHLGIARCYYGLGDAVNAVASADLSLSLDPNLLFQAEFDAANGPTNTIEGALFGRGGFDDYQPLPSLDFLDPKYSFLSNDVDAPIAILKAEEAHLIIAQSQLASNDLAGAQQTLLNLLDLIDTREVRNISDTVEGRTENDPGSRPNNSSVMVRFVGDAAFRAGLVVDRDDSVDVASVSATSIDSGMIDSLGSIEEALETLYLMRQEIFIAEGRRMIDLGIKYPLSENELLLNDNVNEGDPGLTAVIPDFINEIRTELDAFTYDVDAGTVEITHNLNSLLVQNRTSDLVVPFF